MPSNIICISIDRLRASALGSYGAALCDTPGLDRLASESFVFDQALVNRLELESTCHSLWQGVHPAVPSAQQEALALPARLSGEGYHSLLLTDEPRLTAHPVAGAFDSRSLVASGEADAAADEVEETQFGCFFAEAIAALESLPDGKPLFAWLHSQGMGGPWDAPHRFRLQLADPEDPEPPEFVEVPNVDLPSDYDPDVLLGVTQGYAAQAVLLDQCVSALLDFFRESGLADESLLVLLSPRGFALGEHLAVGEAGDRLFSEALHVPLLVRFPDGTGRLCRSPALVEPGDLPATLADWAGVDWPPPGSCGQSLLPLVRGDLQQVRQAIHVCGAGEQAVRTPAFHFRICDPDTPDERRQLFVKPDDAWEANELADRLPDIADGLAAACRDFRAAASRGSVADLPPLDAELLEFENR